MDEKAFEKALNKKLEKAMKQIDAATAEMEQELAEQRRRRQQEEKIRREQKKRDQEEMDKESKQLLSRLEAVDALLNGGKKQKKTNPQNLNEPNCPGQHGLTEFETYVNGYKCNECKTRFPAKTIMFVCDFCNYDLCGPCFGQKTKKKNDDEKKKKTKKK